MNELTKFRFILKNTHRYEGICDRYPEEIIIECTHEQAKNLIHATDWMEAGCQGIYECEAIEIKDITPCPPPKP